MIEHRIETTGDESFLTALTNAGFPTLSVHEIRQRYNPLPTGLIGLLIEWIPRLSVCEQEAVTWTLLAAPQCAVDGIAIANLYDTTPSIPLKAALAAVIHQTRPRGIDEWLASAVSECHSETARNFLAAAIAKTQPAERAIPVLLKVFEVTPLAAVHPLAKIGSLEVRDVLAAKLPSATGPLRREIRQAIARIERRITKASRRPTIAKR